MFYVYILKCQNDCLYTGCTGDLKERIERHKKGQIGATANKLPVELISYIAINDKIKAFEFERYLKSGSGRSFIKRHIVK
jgi:predicted GIY-YIG superfamily endonuclease